MSRRDAEVEAFLRLRAPGLLRVAVVLTGNPDDAQDLVQHVCLSVWKSWSRVQAAGDPVAYANRMLVNAHLSERRRGHWHCERSTAEIPDSAAAFTTSPAESSEGFRLLLGRLPPRQRAALVLRYVGDLDDAAVGEVLGCSPSTVRSQISRALAQLRQRPSDQSSTCDNPMEATDAS